MTTSSLAGTQPSRAGMRTSDASAAGPLRATRQPTLRYRKDASHRSQDAVRHAAFQEVALQSCRTMICWHELVKAELACFRFVDERSRSFAAAFRGRRTRRLDPRGRA